MNRTWRRVATLVIAALAFGTSDAGATTATTLRPSAEAWYRSGPLRALPSQFPANTLHVGASSGAETDRSYLSFPVPSATDSVARAVLTVPVDLEAGTSAPEASVVLACVAQGAVVDRPAPSTEEPPPADCAGAVRLIFDAAAGVLRGEVTALVTPGEATGLALVPAKDSGSWQIGFDSRRAEDPTTATLRVEFAEETPAAVVTPEQAPVQQFGQPDAFASAVGIPALVPPIDVLVDSPVPATESSAAQGGLQRPAVRRAPQPVAGFQYVAVFALPLALVIVGVFLGIGLTRPVEVAS